MYNTSPRFKLIYDAYDSWLLFDKQAIAEPICALLGAQGISAKRLLEEFADGVKAKDICKVLQVHSNLQ